MIRVGLNPASLWIRSSGFLAGLGGFDVRFLVDEPGFRRVWKFVFSRFGPGFDPFLAE